VKLLRILTVAGVIAAISLLAINPVLSTLTSPRWEVWVVDENGHPLQGMTVRLFWANYSIEHISHEEDLQTDENGFVVFPAKTSKTTLKETIVGIMDSIRGSPHSSLGPHASVFAFGNWLEGSAVEGGYVIDWTGRPPRMQTRIVAEPVGR
jgi:hypothetical protein